MVEFANFKKIGQADFSCEEYLWTDNWRAIDEASIYAYGNRSILIILPETFVNAYMDEDECLEDFLNTMWEAAKDHFEKFTPKLQQYELYKNMETWYPEKYLDDEGVVYQIAQDFGKNF